MQNCRLVNPFFRADEALFSHLPRNLDGSESSLARWTGLLPRFSCPSAGSYGPTPPSCPLAASDYTTTLLAQTNTPNNTYHHGMCVQRCGRCHAGKKLRPPFRRRPWKTGTVDTTKDTMVVYSLALMIFRPSPKTKRQAYSSCSKRSATKYTLKERHIHYPREIAQ